MTFCSRSMKLTARGKRFARFLLAHARYKLINKSTPVGGDAIYGLPLKTLSLILLCYICFFCFIVQPGLIKLDQTTRCCQKNKHMFDKTHLCAFPHAVDYRCVRLRELCRRALSLHFTNANFFVRSP